MKFIGLVIVTIAIIYAAQKGMHGIGSEWLREFLGIDRATQTFLSAAYIPAVIVAFIFGVLAYARIARK